MRYAPPTLADYSNAELDRLWDTGGTDAFPPPAIEREMRRRARDILARRRITIVRADRARDILGRP